MVTSTRQTTRKDDALEHVLINLMGINVKSHTYQVIYDACIIDIPSISALTESEISKLRGNMVDEKGNITERGEELPIGHQCLTVDGRVLT
jgi:hypothetical protein